MALITTNSALEKTLSALAQAPFVTVDTEFHRQSTYYPELCLIQIASPAGEALIDPLALKFDLAPFFALMQNPAIVKVFHSARQDIEILFHLSGAIPAPLFDAQIAAMVCGYGDSIAYDSLVEEITGVKLDKSSRFTDWRLRPLSKKQMDYALADVTYLRDIYTALDKKLKESGRASWVKEEMDILTSPETYETRPEEAWKKAKIRAKLKKPEQFSVLQKLAAWRERTAQRQNVPRSYILSDDALSEIALQLPKDNQALLSMRVLHHHPRIPLDIRTVLGEIHAGIKDADTMPPQFVAYHKPSEENKSVTEILKFLLKIIAERHGVVPKIIASSEDISEIAAKGAEADALPLKGWRRDIFGASALAMMSGDLAIKMNNNTPELFAVSE